jgi:hypothetical protein
MITKEGRKILLNYCFGDRYSLSDIQYGLATNVPGGDASDVEMADLTECDFVGYARIENPGVPDADLDGSNRGRIIVPTLTWTAGSLIADQTIRSVFVYFDSVTPANTGLVWWEAISPSVTLTEALQEFSRIFTWLDNNFVP